LLGDVAFVPIEVLLVTLIIHRVLSVREKRAVLDKLNMVVGSFFSEAGNELLRFLRSFDTEDHQGDDLLRVRSNWDEKEFKKAVARVESYACSIDSKKGELSELREFLVRQRAFLLRLLENPVLLEHESFTDLLWAVFHLADELAHRDASLQLTAPDYAHLSGDIKRVYVRLIGQWLHYLQHLRKRYPYLFSLALRLNPFDPQASVQVR